jgi:hypothetical protein
MPLHDWNKTKGWSGVHLLWMAELLRWIKPRLPEGYRAYVGTSPVVAVEDPGGEPDVSVRRTDPVPPVSVLEGNEQDPFQPDRVVALAATLEEDKSLYVEWGGRLIAAIELVSYGNKDRAERKAKYLTRYLGYLTNGVHLLLADLHPRPPGYSFADEIAARLEVPDEPPLPPPFVISYRVNLGGAFGGGGLDLRRQRLTVGQPLPTVPLSLAFPAVVPIDLEATYMRAAADAYLA